MSRWKWENSWLMWTVLSLWALPLALGWAAVPHPIQVYGATPWTSQAVMGVMGILWGAGVLLLGMSFPRVGVAVGASVALGCSAAVGTVLPILFADAPMRGSTGLKILLGAVAVVLGVAVCGFAGQARERRQGTCVVARAQSTKGFLFASVGGTLAAALNLAFVSGTTIAASVEAQRPSTALASIAVWMPVLLAGGIPGALYTLSLLMEYRSMRLHRQQGTRGYWLLASHGYGRVVAG
jgi:L-rhamnose-H+ transport protein